MKKESQNLYALITGASAGTGKQLAVECAKRGFNVFLVSLPNTGLEEFANELKEEYLIDARYLSIDLTASDSPEKVFEYATSNNITVNMLINNAGLGFNGKLEDLDIKLIDIMILLNVRASTLLTYLFLPGMKKLEQAYILNIGSFAGLTPLANKSVYAATKTFILFFTRALNIELKDTGISATSVHPCGISSERAMENIKKSGFLGRLSSLTPEQVAKTAIESMLKRKKFVIPGFCNKAYYTLGTCLPHGIVLKLVGNVFKN